jgi:hypothetical protein
MSGFVEIGLSKRHRLEIAQRFSADNRDMPRVNARSFENTPALALGIVICGE